MNFNGDIMSLEDIQPFFDFASRDSNLTETFDNGNIHITAKKEKRWILSNIAELLSAMGVLVKSSDNKLIICC